MKFENRAITASIFKNEEWNSFFNEQGYVVVDFLPAETVKALTAFYNAHPNPFKAEFHTTHFATDKEYKKAAHDTIVELMAPFAKKVLPGHKPVFGNFMVKEAGGNNAMPMHADWAYVDEPENTSVAIWVPLVDTIVENGCLGVIPYSQHISFKIRGPRIQQWQYPVNERLIKEMGKLLPLKAGQAVIYNHRLLHFSPPNNSNSIRVAINLSLVPEGVQMVHYTIPEGSEAVQKYNVDSSDFFIYYDNFQIPQRGTVAANILPGEIPLINTRVEGFINKYGNLPLFERLKSAFYKLAGKTPGG